MDTCAVLDEYLDKKEACLNDASNQEILQMIDDSFVELNKLDNSPYSEEEKNKRATEYARVMYRCLHQKPFLVCSKFMDESKFRSKKSLVARTFVYVLKEYFKKFKQEDVGYTLAELYRTHYCTAVNNDSYVHDMYVYTASKGHKMSLVRLQQEKDIYVAHKCVMTPVSKGIVHSQNVARGIGMYRTLFEQGRLDVVPELLRTCASIKDYQTICDVLFFLDNDFYTEQFAAQLDNGQEEKCIADLRKLYKKSKFLLFMERIGNVIRKLLYALLIVGAVFLVMAFSSEAWYFLVSGLFIYFTVGSFIIERPVYFLILLPLSLIGGTLTGIGSADWDTFGEALVVSSLM